MTKILAAVLLGGTTLTSGAFAQDATAEGDAVKAVYERYRPDYDAAGIRTGSFLFFPSVAADGTYNSNIYAQHTDKTDDFVAKVRPSFTLASDWNSDLFSLSANADIGRYVNHSGEDYADFGVVMNGRKDISHGVDLHGSVSFDHKHEDRGSADSSGSLAEPTKYNEFVAKAGYKHDVSVLSLAIDGQFTRKDFSNTPVIDSPTPRNNNVRDRDRYQGSVRVGYELADGYEAFVRGTLDRVKYDDSTAEGGPNRNSDGLTVVGGAAFDLTGKAQGEFFVGYMRRAYDSVKLNDVSGINYGGSLLWSLSGLTSLRGTITREIGETTVGGTNKNGKASTASSVVSTLFSLRAEHELRRNLLLSAEGSYTRQAFQGITRKDDLYSVKLGMKYLLNRNFNVNASYGYNYRDSSKTNLLVADSETYQDYGRHTFMIGVTGQW